jgi:hypothetical protein
VTEYIIGCQRQVPPEVTRLDFEVPADYQVHLRELFASNNFYEIELVDGRLGDKLLPFDGPLDMGFFGQRHAFKVGTMTEEAPLTLYVRAFGVPAVNPYLGLHLIGDIEEWTPPEVSVEHRHRVGELTIQEYTSWLAGQDVHPHIRDELLEPVRRFLNKIPLKGLSTVMLLDALRTGNLDLPEELDIDTKAEGLKLAEAMKLRALRKTLKQQQQQRRLTEQRKAQEAFRKSR